MNVLNSYLRSKLDLSHVGFQRGEKWSDYFCTPLNAKVIGWAGVDGIHFCTIKGFDEIIFAINPTYDPGHYVHPVARNFEDFLRLILACNDTAAIEQCWFMDREVFGDFLKDNPPTPEGQKCLDAIRKKYQLTPMEDPFSYIHELQESFDYDSLQFPPEYYELVDIPSEPQAPEWKVTWDGDIFDADPDAESAEPVAVNARFQWAGLDWFVPEVYPFERGVVMLLLGKVDPELVPRYGYEDYISPEAHERIMAENPLEIHVRPELTINDLALRPSGSVGTNWIPGQGHNLEAKWVLQHYDLDLDSAWQIKRLRFFWPSCGMMEIQKMSLTMKQHPVSVSGTRFKTPDAGNCVILTHPLTEKEYILHIDEIKQETADFSRMQNQTMEYPVCYTQMQFRIEPDMPRNQFRIVDCSQSDQPRHRHGAQQVGSAVIGIIGGADGPTAIFVGQTKGDVPQSHRAMSALHFEHPKKIEWRIVFQEKPNDDLKVSLL